MTLICHKPTDSQTHAYPIAVGSVERSFESLHCTLVVSERAQSLAGGDEYCALVVLLILCCWHGLDFLLGQLHVLQSLLTISEFGIGTRQLSINQGIVWGELSRDLQFIDGGVVLAEAI